SHAVLEDRGPQRWPFPRGTSSGLARLYEDLRFATDDGRARFVPISLSTTAEKTDARFPLHLNTGRLRDQWHGMSRTGKLAHLMNHADLPAAALNPIDLERRSLKAGELVSLKSRRGAIVLPVAADPALKPGHVFVPMHWGRRRLAHAGANELIAATVDPYSRQPELKHGAIALVRAELPWRGVLLRQARGAAAAETALEIESALAPFLEQFDYASLTLCGRNEPVITLHLAAKSAPSAQLLEPILTAAGLAAAPLHYEDPSRHINKRALIEHDRLVGIALFGETAAADWLRAAMLADQPASPLRRLLFAPVAKAPAGQPARGRIVCACRDVSADQIKSAISTGATDLAKLQARLPCGTGCGACVPELNRILSGAREAA
ncbi:MAG: molybdopterin dinucleotide binding domain-containing protein, partial [Rhodocyclaceae bacterium]